MQNSTIAMMITLDEMTNKPFTTKKNLQPLLDLLCYQAWGDNNCMGESSEGEGFSSQHWIRMGRYFGVSECMISHGKRGIASFLFGVSYS